MKSAVAAISFDKVSKEYLVHHDRHNLAKNLWRSREEKFFALRDISLTVNKGEIIGIVGDNGSGKTTVLKLIAGVTAPTSGRVRVSGSIVSLLDLEAGFHDELTGIQNIYLNGMILGMSRLEVNRRLASIIRFADIGRFIDAPLYTYSAGMKVRLGFAVAVNADSDILIFDEQLSVGDHNFHLKADAEILKLFHQGKTIVVVSHWLPFIRSTCRRILVLKRGRIVADGTVALLNKYRQNLI